MEKYETSAATIEKEKQTQHFLSAINEKVERLRKLTYELSTRLSPVLPETEPVNAIEERVPEPNLVPLAQELNEILIKLEGNEDMISYIITKMEL